MTLGHYGKGGEMTLEDARATCLNLRKLRKGGTDPQTHQRGEAAEARAVIKQEAAERLEKERTIKALCTLFMRARDPHWRSSTAKENGRIIEVEILPRWGRRPVANLRKSEISDAFDAILARAPVMANRFLWLVRNLLDFATEKEWIDANPVPTSMNKRRYREKPRERVLDDRELRKLLKWLDGDALKPHIAELIRFVLITGVRLGEAAGANVSEIDLEDCKWTIPAERMKGGRAHTVLLSRQSMPIIEDRINTANEVGYLWPGLHGRGHQQVTSVGLAIRNARDTSGIPLWTCHDLRRSFASGCGELGVARDVISRLLAHGGTGVTAMVYDLSKRDQQAAAAWQTWADHLDQLQQPKVVPMMGKQRA